MKLNLEKSPQNVRLVVGFPGFGLVGTIATKFLIEHLDVEKIGSVHSHKLLPLAAIHKGNLIGPLDLFYSKKHNMVILQTLSELAGSEWDMGEIIGDIAHNLKAKEVVVLEGLPTDKSGTKKVYFYSENSKSMSKLGIPELKEGVLMGVTATLMLHMKEIPVTSILAESPSKYPDSDAAARTIQTLDKYWKMDIDYKPLMKAAKSFESMLKQMMGKVKEQQSGNINSIDPKKPAYIG